LGVAFEQALRRPIETTAFIMHVDYFRAAPSSESQP
jgi:hypothetical protein